MDARQFVKVGALEVRLVERLSVKSLQRVTLITSNISDEMALVPYIRRGLVYRQELSLSGRNLLFGGYGNFRATLRMGA
jgi:hypothetical protein